MTNESNLSLVFILTSNQFYCDAFIIGTRVPRSERFETSSFSSSILHLSYDLRFTKENSESTIHEVPSCNSKIENPDSTWLILIQFRKIHLNGLSNYSLFGILSIRDFSGPSESFNFWPGRPFSTYDTIFTQKIWFPITFV